MGTTYKHYFFPCSCLLCLIGIGYVVYWSEGVHRIEPNPVIKAFGNDVNISSRARDTFLSKKTGSAVKGSLTRDRSGHKPRDDVESPRGRRKSKPRVVVMWTSHYKKRLSKELNSRDVCGMKGGHSCVMTPDRSRYKEADGVVFFLWPGSWDGTSPPKRYPWQHYIVYTAESTSTFGYSKRFNDTLLPLISQPGFVNLTATFRRDSDFHIPYMTSQPRDTPCTSCRPNSKLIGQKNKLMIWLVSHCKTPGKRELYMKDLYKYIKVDVFGRCGNETACRKGNITKGCSEKLMMEYKFYFAAENSICKDYFTEKLSRSLHLPIVPVVYGSKEVHQIAPPGSYIDVRDFKSPKHLADYLLYLDKNNTAYMKYFKWKEYYKVTSTTAHYRNTFCRYCKFLKKSNTHRIIPDFVKWFYEDSGCKNDLINSLLGAHK